MFVGLQVMMVLNQGTLFCKNRIFIGKYGLIGNDMVAAMLVALSVFVSACNAKPVESLSSMPLYSSNEGETGLTIEWKALSDPKEREKNDSWHKGVGPPVIILPPNTQDENEFLDALVVVSWNVRVGGADLGRFISDLRSGRFTDGIPVSHCILLLQEAFRAGAPVPETISTDTPAARYVRPEPPSGERLDIIEIARRFHLGLYYVPSMRNGRQADTHPPEDKGNAILSTLPISSPFAVELPHERQRRVAIGATLGGKTSAGAPWTLRVFNVHLENRSRWRRLYYSFGDGRRRQANALAKEFLADIPTVLGGDLLQVVLGLGGCGQQR